MGLILLGLLCLVLITFIVVKFKAMKQAKEFGLDHKDELDELANAFDLKSFEVGKHSEMHADELMSTKTKLQAILFSIEDGIVMVDFKGKILLLNDSAKKMMGIQKKFPYEKKFLDYIDDPFVKDKLSSILEAKENALEIELIVPQGQDKLFLKATKNLVTTAKGEVLGRVIALRDVTLEKQLETMKDDFIHSVTHDLKSPLTSVQGFLKLFLENEIGPVTKEQKHYLEAMEHSTQKVLKLINNILDFAKVEAGKMALSKSEWDVTAAVHQLVESLQGLAKHHQIKLYYVVSSPPSDSSTGSEAVLEEDSSLKTKNESEKSPPQLSQQKTDLMDVQLRKVTVFADGTFLERVISNLVDNALKFTSLGGTIEIKIEDTPRKVVISVSDTGKGIPPESLDKIFQKFNQVPGTKGGTGLGLTISKHIVEAHGGEISVASQVGKGTTFRFWIPKEPPLNKSSEG